MSMTADTTKVLAPGPGVAARVGGAAAVAFVALALAGNSLTGGGVAPGSPPEAYAQEVVRRTGELAWRIGIGLELVAFVALLVFGAALGRRVRSCEPREGYAGWLVLAGSILFVAVKLASGSALYAADHRSGDLEPAIARLLSDLNDAAFALSFVPLAVLLAAAAVGSLAHAALPRLLGWTAAPLAVLLLVAAATGSDAVPIPFLLTLVWLLATGITMLRRPVPNAG